MASLKKIKISSIDSASKKNKFSLKVVLGTLLGASFVSIVLGPIVYLSFPSLQMIYLNLVANSFFY